MSSIELKRLARRIARLEQGQANMSKPQLAYSSIENGNIKSYEGDDLKMSIGLQDDGSSTMRFFDGPIPPVPSGFTALADGPLIQGTWDGTFEDGAEATYDLAYLEVAATLVEDGSRVSFATITAKEGASTSVVANQSGVWAVAVRSVSQAGKKSEFASAGTVEVKLVDLAGAIEDVQQSANGKNKVHYSSSAPTPEDAGIIGDTWWVGADGRPEEILATNLLTNASFENGLTSYIQNTSLSTNTITTSQPFRGQSAARIEAKAAATTFTYIGTDQFTVTAGQWLGTSAKVRADTTGVHSRTRLIFYSSTGSQISAPYLTDVTALGSTYVGLNGAVEVPAGAVSARLYAYLYSNASGAKPSTGQAMVTDAWSAILAPTETTALAIVATYFDGDTPPGTTDSESHYRWTGTPHASTSEMYLPEVGSGTWNITEQWQYTSDGWVQVELSHEVIATVDLGKATVGELDGIRIMSKTIGADQLAADFADFVVARGGTFLTSNGGGQWSDDGLFINAPDGTSLVRFPTDGTPLSLAASDTQIQRAQVDALEFVEGNLRSGGVLSLASGVTPPASPPELSAAWQRVASLPRPPEQSMDWNGLAAWGDKWVRAVNVLGSAGDASDRIEIYNADGTLDRSFTVGVNPRHGVAVLGDIVYTMGQEHVANGKNYTEGWNLNTGTRTARWVYPRDIYNQFGAGTDGTNLVFAGVFNNTLYVLKFNPTTGAQVGGDATTPWPSSLPSDLKGVQINGSTVLVQHKNGSRGYTLSGTNLTLLDGSNAVGWANPNQNAGGFVLKAGIPWVVDSGAIFQGASFSDGVTVQACYTWWNGTSETTPTPVAAVTVRRHEAVTVSMGKRAGLQKRLYVKSSLAASWAQVTVPEDTTMLVLTAPATGTATLPTANTFPASTPARMKSSIGQFEVKGDGSGRWGPLTFNADGTMTSTAIPVWVPITTFASGFSAQSWGDVPSYRIWPDGKVEWRGVIAGTMSGTTSIKLFTIPAAARPGRPKNKSTAVSGAATWRVEFGPTVDASAFLVYPDNTSRTWVSIDELFYYLT